MEPAIIYEDEEILIVDKPLNMLVHPSSSLHKPDLLTLIGHPEYGVITRLDYQTSGLVLLGKNKRSLSLLSIMQRQNKIKKFYHAIVSGHFPELEGILRCYLLIDERSSLVRTFDNHLKDAKETITMYRVLAEDDDYSLLEIELITGRTHQIRAVMAHFNHPLAGDPLYGRKDLNRKLKLRQQALTAMRLQFDVEDENHPLHYLNGKVFSKKVFPYLDIMKKR
ncbi:MAG: RluA family pseudouridine synthase [Candidatus Izemoplasmatales bacterium]|jgi:23S rRNA pseudouridine955/2504/2580 synthase